MTTKHTPGCRFTPDPSWSILESEDGRRLTIDCDGGPMLPRKVIATVYNSRRVDGKANARLIAAAPDLLAALEETLRALEQHLDDDTNAHGLKHRDILCPCNANEVVRARAAISRAKGGAS